MAAGHEDIFPTVVIEVHDAEAKPGTQKARLPHAVGIGDFLKFPSLLITKDGEGLIRERGKGNVWVTVVIYVAEIEAHAGDEPVVHDLERIRAGGESLPRQAVN